MAGNTVAKIALQAATYAIDKPYDYQVPMELLDQLHEVTGTAIPRRLAALKGKARRFDLTCEKPGMDGVVLEFLK